MLRNKVNLTASPTCFSHLLQPVRKGDLNMSMIMKKYLSIRMLFIIQIIPELRCPLKLPFVFYE